MSFLDTFYLYTKIETKYSISHSWISSCVDFASLNYIGSWSINLLLLYTQSNSTEEDFTEQYLKMRTI